MATVPTVEQVETDTVASATAAKAKAVMVAAVAKAVMVAAVAKAETVATAERTDRDRVVTDLRAARTTTTTVVNRYHLA
jgi:hypothetical protein